jgi:hypothetical protein
MQTLGLPKDAAHFYPLPNDWVQLLELLNKVCDLADLIEDRFSRFYAKTVVLSCFQLGDRACGFKWSTYNERQIHARNGRYD